MWLGEFLVIGKGRLIQAWSAWPTLCPVNAESIWVSVCLCGFMLCFAQAIEDKMSICGLQSIKS